MRREGAQPAEIQNILGFLWISGLLGCFFFFQWTLLIRQEPQFCRTLLIEITGEFDQQNLSKSPNSSFIHVLSVWLDWLTNYHSTSFNQTRFYYISLRPWFHQIFTWLQSAPIICAPKNDQGIRIELLH